MSTKSNFKKTTSESLAMAGIQEADETPVTVERQELMVSPSGSCPVLRTAHFLTPSFTSLDSPVAAPPPDSLTSIDPFLSKHKDLPLKVSFRGLTRFSRKWKSWKCWVDEMRSLHHLTWKKAGIYEAIMNSTQLIHQNDDLIFGFAEKWCGRTNTFVFPWGEATVTLEDMMVLGGYSVLGESVWSPLGDSSLEEIEEELNLARLGMVRSQEKKASLFAWMSKFRNTGSRIEHEAFIAYWLARFVFPVFCVNTVGRSVFSIGVRLARGAKIALAPAVLASIYQNMSLLKAVITAARKVESEECDCVYELSVSSPLALVQVWIWERFPVFRPWPSPIRKGEARFAKWRGLKSEDVGDDVLLMIDASGDSFQWRPYAGTVYRDKESWALVDSDLDEELEGFVRCVRPSELVGLVKNCIEHYSPHRMAMQFGMDQDLPGCVARVNENHEMAWSYYTRPVRDATLYVPARLFEGDVTVRYLEWWKNLKLDCSDMIDAKPKTSSSKRIKFELGSLCNSKNLEQFQVAKNANIESLEVFPKESSLPPVVNSGVATSDGSKREFGGNKSSAQRDFSASVSPPPGFDSKHCPNEKLMIGKKRTVLELSDGEGNGISQCRVDANGISQSRGVAHGQSHFSPAPENGSFREVALSAVSGSENDMAVQSCIDGLKNIVENRIHAVEPPVIELEERVERLEMLCSWLQAGTLGCN